MKMNFRLARFTGLLTALIAVLVLTFAFVQPVAAATITVDTANDELDGAYATHCDPGNESDCSLREAIELSNSNGEDDVIVLEDNTTYAITISASHEDLNQSGDFDIYEVGQTLEIQGGSMALTWIDGGDIDRVFDVDNSSLTLTDLSVMEGNTTADAEAHASSTGGGLIRTDNDSELTLESVRLSQGTANSASALQAFETDVSLTNVEIADNEAVNSTGNPGAVIIDANNQSVTATIDNTQFIRNSSEFTSSCDRGLHLETSGHQDLDLIITNSVFYQASLTCNGSQSSVGQDMYFYIGSGTGGTVNMQNVIVSSDHGGEALVMSGNASTGLNAFRMRNVTILDGEVLVRRNNNLLVTSSIFTGGCSTTDSGQVTSGGYNIDLGTTCGFSEPSDQISTDPLISEDGADEYGNFFDDVNFLTVLLQSESPAIDAIPAESCLDYTGLASLDEDVRGYERPDNNNCDIGAMEMDQTNPVVSITSNTDETNVLECNVDSWTDPGATASDNYNAFVDEASAVSGTVTTTTVGDYIISYQSEADYDGNQGTAQRTVTVADTTAPTITVAGSNETVEAGGTYEDNGASVTDLCDSTVTLTTNNPVDEDTLGEYTVTYSATDASDNEAQKTRTVSVTDTIAPVITLTGDSAITLTVGDSYSDAGATATDTFEGDLTEDITVSGSVDTDTAGEYTLTYSVADSSGNNATTVSRTVTVLAAEDSEPDNDVDSGEGDGSGDSEETLGDAVSRERLTGGRVLVTYEGGEQKIFQLFNINGKPKAVLHTNGDIIVAINKKNMRTFNAYTGEQIDQVKLFKKKQAHTKMKRYNVYKNKAGQNNIVVLGRYKTNQRKKVSMRSFVVKNGGMISRQNIQRIELNNNTKFSKLTTSKNKKNGRNARIRLERKGKVVQAHKYKITKKKGRLVSVN